MKLEDKFPSTQGFRTLLCSNSNKKRLQKLVFCYLTDVSKSVDKEIIYSIASHYTNLSTQQSMEMFSFDQSEADTILFSAYIVLRESGYSGPVAIDATDTDAYVTSAAISQQQPGMLCIKRKNEFILCRGMVTEEMSECIVQLHSMTGCDANSGFYGKGKMTVYDRVVKSSEARQLLLHCGDSLDLKEEVLDDLLCFIRKFVYGDNKSINMAEARAAKWKKLKKKSFIHLPPDTDSLLQHCRRANFLAYLIRHPSLKNHPSPLGHGWELDDDGHCRPVRHTQSALPTYLSTQEPTEEGERDENNEGDEERAEVQSIWGDSSDSYDSELSDHENSDSD